MRVVQYNDKSYKIMPGDSTCKSPEQIDDQGLAQNL